MTQTRWLNEQEARMWRAYLGMQRDLDRALERQLYDAGGLSTADYALLVPLSETDGHRLRARDLGLYIGWDRSRLSHHIRRMEQRGLVSKHKCPTDLRGTFIQLEPAGLAAVKQAAPGHVAVVRKYLIDLMSPEEIATLHAVSRRVSARVAADSAGSDCETRPDGFEASPIDCGSED